MRLFRFVAVLVLLIAIAGAGAGYLLWTRLQQPFQAFAGERFVEVPTGASSREIGRQLTEAGVVSDPWTFRAALWWTGRARGLKAGEYRFDMAASPLAVVDRMARGDVYEVRITFPEGLTIDEMAAAFEGRELGPASAFREAARDVSLIADLDPAARDLEGYLFPETYPVPRQLEASTLVRAMAERFKAVYAEVSKGRDTGGLTTRQIVALASLIEKETARADERPLVSAVYRNRLKIGMGMQADPTVVYALRKAGRYNGNIRRVDLALDSPYNTYR
ncbi:MAG TPA: endolytic transglycosylase MltG, partial [Planctomycetota bacterium]|nr:endolytic transglycosylase MltG [Planctomycetota bacterium]